MDRDQERDVRLPQHEDCSVLYRPGQKYITYQTPCLHWFVLIVRLEDRTRDQILLEEGFGAHVVSETKRQMIDNRLHRMSGLLASDSQVLLQRPGQRWEDSLCRLFRVHWDRRTCDTNKAMQLNYCNKSVIKAESVIGTVATNLLLFFVF